MGRGVEVGCNTVIQRGTLSDTIIGDGTLIGDLVEIGHDVKAGVGSLIVSQAGISGNVTIGDGVEIYGQAGVANWLDIGDGATIMAKAGIGITMGCGGGGCSVQRVDDKSTNDVTVKAQAELITLIGSRSSMPICVKMWLGS